MKRTILTILVTVLACFIVGMIAIAAVSMGVWK